MNLKIIAAYPSTTQMIDSLEYSLRQQELSYYEYHMHCSENAKYFIYSHYCDTLRKLGQWRVVNVFDERLKMNAHKMQFGEIWDLIKMRLFFLETTEFSK